RLLGRSGTLRSEQIGLTSILAADQIRDQLAGRGRERDAVTGESGVHEHAAVEPPDIRQRIVRKPHRARPAMRHRRFGGSLAQKALEPLLDFWRRPLLFTNLLVGGGVTPSADEQAA